MSTVNRRSFIGGAAFGLTAAVAAPTLAGCTAKGGGETGTVSTDLAPLPKYVPILKGPKPDLAGTKAVQPVYFSPVTDYFQSVTGKIGNGSTVSALAITYAPPPPPNNEFLKYIGSKANVTFDMSIVPADSYSEKFATVVAGGDLPDFVEFLAFQLPPRFPDLLDAKFADLTEHLSGAAVKKYPNLANIPTPSWLGCRINGRIYGVPIPRPPFGDALIIRRDLIEQYGGGGANPGDKDEFMALCKDVTSAADERYALGGVSSATGVNFATAFINSMFHVPNNWKFSNGDLTHMYETSGWMDALEYTRKLWKAGVFHPDTPSLKISQAKTYLQSGRILMYTDGIGALTSPKIPADVGIDAMVPFGAKGGAGISYQGASMFSFTAIKKSKKARVEELLRVLNYLSAPYGSKEAQDLHWGKEGVDFTTQADGSRVITAQGKAEIGPSDLNRIGHMPNVLQPKGGATPTKETLTRAHTYEKKTAPMLVPDPTFGHYSPTEAKAGSATQAVSDAATGYVLGRKDLDAVKSAVKSWKSSVGNKMRKEYLKSMSS